MERVLKFFPIFILALSATLIFNLSLHVSEFAETLFKQPIDGGNKGTCLYSVLVLTYNMASSNHIRRIFAIKDTYAITDTNDTMIFVVQPIDRFPAVNPTHGQVGSQTMPSNGVRMAQVVHSSGIRSKRAELTYNHVAEKFIMPQSAAAKELDVSRTTLKFRCRELSIPEWPYKKMKFLATLEASVSSFTHPGVQHVIRYIREEMNAIKQNSSLDISEATYVLKKQFTELEKKRKRSGTRAV